MYHGIVDTGKGSKFNTVKVYLTDPLVYVGPGHLLKDIKFSHMWEVVNT